MIEIAISVVCYDNEDEILKFADKLSQQKDYEKIILLVTCNKCKNVKELVEKLNKIRICSKVFNPGNNLGYLHGCLYGLKVYGTGYKWAIISNTDIDFVSSEFFSSFLKKNYEFRIGCIGPDITLKSTQKHQNPFALTRPNNIIMKIRKKIYSSYRLYNLYNYLSKLKNKIYNSKSRIESGYVYAVHGSMIILRKECIDKFLEDNIQIFMYVEELYIAEKLRENHILSYCDMNLKVIHNENQVTGKISSERKQKWFSQSINFLVNRYWN